MRKSRFSEAQMVRILREIELSAMVGEPSRKHGLSEPTYCKWKSRFSGTTASRPAQPRQLLDEDGKLRRMSANLTLMHHALKDIVDRKP